MSDLVKMEYKITSDPSFLNKQNAITPELQKRLQDYHELALEGKRSSIQKLLDAIERYPRNPQLKNFLSVLYMSLNEPQKMREVNRWIIAEHPDYLIGKINLANEYFMDGEYHKIPEVLGPDMEIKGLYPHRDLFHIAEVLAFMKTAVMYFTAIEDLEQAYIRFSIMNDLAPYSNDTEIAKGYITKANLIAIEKRKEEEEKTKISVKTKVQELTLVIHPPKFLHQEIEWLYNHDLTIAEEKLEAILELSRESLIKDLEMVLQDSIIRFNYFLNSYGEGNWVEEKMNFLIHAIYLLGELKATESIQIIFDVLSQSPAYLDLYFGDFKTSMFWEPLYKLIGHDLELAMPFMLRPGVDAFARSNISDMMLQIALHHPERCDEVINWYDRLFDAFLNLDPEDNIIDSELNGLVICEILDLKAVELLPKIETLFKRGWVSTFICGDWEFVEKDMHEERFTQFKDKILSITDRYKEIISTWHSYTNDIDDEEIIMADLYDDFDNLENYDEQLFSEPYKAPPKAGRNDPCPCGSGKKYKKCCLAK